MHPIQTQPKISNAGNLRILYLSVNSSYSHSSLVYGQLRGLCENYVPEWEWDIVECTINDNINEVLLKLLNQNANLIVSTVYLFNRKFILELISKFSILTPDTKFVLGGPEFLDSNEEFLRSFPQISAVFRGDESSFPFYLRTVSSYALNDLEQIPGICFINKRNYYIDNGTAQIQGELDKLPSPYTNKYIALNKPFIQLETSRGCPSKCSFCTSSLSRDVKYYSLDRIRNDLEQIRNLNIKEIRVLDRTFNIPSTRAANILKLFIDNFSDLRFHMEFNPSLLKNEIIHQLRLAPKGQFHIEAGIQTLYMPALNAINRKFSHELTIEKLKELVKLDNIEVHTDLLYGLPKQTLLSIFEDLNTIISIAPDEIQIENLKILPGTPISNIQELKYSSQPPYEILSNSELNLKDIQELSYLSKIIDSYYNVKTTKNLFRFAVKNDKLFLQKFLHFAGKNFAKAQKPSPSIRFKLLFDYSKKEEDKLLYSVILFSYFCSGFFQSPINNIKLIKKNELSELLTNKYSVIWDTGEKIIEKPAYLASFDFNTADLWVNPLLQPIKENSKYLFLLSQGGMNRKVSKILRIE